MIIAGQCDVPLKAWRVRWYGTIIRIGGYNMKGSMSTDHGIITVSSDVIAKYEGWHLSFAEERETDPWNPGFYLG